VAVAVRRGRREWWLRVNREGITTRDMSAAARKLRARLAGGDVLRRAEIEALVGTRAAAGVGLWVEMVRAPPSGTWERRRADMYAAAEVWLGPADVGLDDAVDALVRRYMTGFAPATLAETAGWAGIPAKHLAPAFARLRLRRFASEDGEELVDLPRAPLPDAETPAPVRLLGTWDAMLLAHARRAGVLPEHHRERVFSTRTPQSVPTFLVDGAVAGAWRHEKGRVSFDPLERIDRATMRSLREEGERMAAFHSG
jgi:hypothetical protein